ncbi:MAG: glycine zipper family protein [Mariprofundaceae bacterium]|nr:glycine zipper family protein [Mariprofundaceae bacterium]
MNKLLMVMLILGLSACATYEQQRAATTGAVAGGVAGAVIGAGSGRAVEGAAIGAVIGGVTGAVISEPRNQRYGQDRHHRGYGQGAVIVVPRGYREDDDGYEYEEHDD